MFLVFIFLMFYLSPVVPPADLLIYSAASRNILYCSSNGNKIQFLHTLRNTVVCTAKAHCVMSLCTGPVPLFY